MWKAPSEPHPLAPSPCTARGKQARVGDLDKLTSNHGMITFATRGSSDRTQAFKAALEAARRRFEKKWDIHTAATIQIQAVPAATKACVQAADYFLWAIQRCYERREDRYMDYVWSRCRLIWDVDDRRKNKYAFTIIRKRR